MAIPGKEGENGVYEFPYMIRPVQRTKWEAFKLFVWNPSKKKFCGRTAESWAKILIFYIIFYIGLAALFAMAIAVLFATLDEDKPKYTASSSLIGTNPGLGFRPIADETAQGALIWYNPTDANTYKKWTSLLDSFMQKYNLTDPERRKKFSPECSFTQGPIDGKACPVNINEFGPCNGENYGYNTTSPCVFLKLNRIYDWIPEYINSSKNLPEDMPEELKERIKLMEQKNEANRVWVSCQGEYPADKEHILPSNFSYYPTGGGFPAYYYPYQQKKDEYLSPLIAVHLKHPKGGVIINIECRVWANNIKYKGGIAEKRQGSVHFEIMRDDY